MPTASKSKIPKIKTENIFYQAFLKIDETIKFLNTNTLFVGLMMFVMNIASRFVNIKLSRSMEGYMKFSFSKDILVFTIAFIGTRNLYWALFITLLFIVFMDYLFNENSAFCCLPESFTDKHIALLEQATDSSGNLFGGKGGSGVMGMGVAMKDSSISGAPGLGYSTGYQDSQGQKMAVEDLGPITEEEKQKITQVLLQMRGGAGGGYSSIGQANYSGNRKLNDGPISSLYSSYH
jgi:hypothetical protein